MADESGGSSTKDDNIATTAPKTFADQLRKVEEDVLIPKMIREKAKIICQEHVDAMVSCCKGRSVSMLWACRQENKKMKDCLLEAYNNAELQAQCREEYLKKRDEFQKELKQSGSVNNLKKSSPR